MPNMFSNKFFTIATYFTLLTNPLALISLPFIASSCVESYSTNPVVKKYVVKSRYLNSNLGFHTQQSGSSALETALAVREIDAFYPPPDADRFISPYLSNATAYATNGKQLKVPTSDFTSDMTYYSLISQFESGGAKVDHTKGVFGIYIELTSGPINIVTEITTR